MELDVSVLEPALEAMPVFPLPGVVLFPRAILPLHVFEPRYRAMLAASLASHKCIAMAFAGEAREGEGGGEGGGLPPIARIAGAGYVVRHESLPDGRSNLLLHGRARVALEELPFVAPFRRARARVLREVATDVDPAHRAALLAAAAQFVTEARRRDADIEFLLPEGADASATADLAAHHLLLDADVRQRALEELDVGARVLLVTGALAEQTARLSRERGRRREAN